MITFDELELISFAGITDRCIRFEHGLNLLVGENESGKSSVLACLGWVLYGFASSGEKKAMLPLSGDLPCAALTLSADGVRYRILRQAGKSGKEKVQLTVLPSGEEIPIDKEPGEYFFSVDRDLFDQTARIRQGSGSAVDGKKTAQGMNNLLFSANEEIDVESAMKRLHQARVALWHLNRKGGRISEQEEKLAELRGRLGVALQGSENILSLENSIKEKKKTLESHREQAEKFRLELLSYRVRCRREKEELLSRRQTEWEQSERAYQDRKNGGLDSGFVPDSAYIAAMRDLEGRLRDAERDKKRAEAAFANLDREGQGEEKRTVRLFQSHGGAEQVRREAEEGLKKAKRFRLIGRILCVIVIGILFLRRAKAEEAKVAELLGEFSVDTVEELQALAEKCDSSVRSAQERARVLEENAKDAEERLSGVQAACEEMAEKAGCDFASAIWQIGAYEADLARLKNIARDAQLAFESMQTLLSQEPVVETGGEVLPELAPDFDPNAANVSYQFYAKQIPLLENQVHQYQIRLTELSARREDPAEIADAIAEGEGLLSQMREEYEAITLANDRLTEASATLRDHVSVRIAEKAAGYLEKMTGGRFEHLSLDVELQMQTTHPDQNGMTVPLSFLSEGTRNQAYLSLRLALSDILCTDHLPPLLLDEALVYLDDTRLTTVLSMLDGMKEHRQVLLFSASTREKRIAHMHGIDAACIDVCG